MSIDISIEKTQNTGFYYFGKWIPATEVWVRFDNLPSGKNTVIANIGGFEGTVENINDTSAIVPVVVPNGSYLVTCDYYIDEGYYTCNTSIPITVNDNDPSIISWCNQQNNPQSSTSTSTKTTSYGTGSSVQKSKSSSSNILLWIGFVSIGGFIIYKIYKLLFQVKGDKK